MFEHRALAQPATENLSMAVMAALTDDEEVAIAVVLVPALAEQHLFLPDVRLPGNHGDVVGQGLTALDRGPRRENVNLVWVPRSGSKLLTFLCRSWKPESQ
jgi:hypothetical protein